MKATTYIHIRPEDDVSAWHEGVGDSYVVAEVSGDGGLMNVFIGDPLKAELLGFELVEAARQLRAARAGVPDQAVPAGGGERCAPIRT